MSRIATSFYLAAALLVALAPAALAQQVLTEPESAQAARTTDHDGGFVITNAAGDTLFAAEPSHQIRMGNSEVTDVYVSRGGTGGLQVLRHAASGSGLWSVVTNPESGFYAVRGDTEGRGAGVLGVGLAGGTAAGVFGVSEGGNAGVRGYGYGAGGMGGVFYSNTSTIEPALAAEYGGTGPGAAFIARRYSINPEANIALFGVGRVGTEDEAYVTGITGAGNVWTRGNIHADGNIHARGTITSEGADFAERFEVVGEVAAYAPGDVLQISHEADRHLELTAEPYSRRIAGVYATKPGVLLGNLDAEASVPLGVVGVVPTKVTAEGGAIHRGDLLVTSSTPGHAMKGDPELIRVGMVIGRALQDFDDEGTGVIEVLVNVQ
jgi:hypothetical protein